MLSSIRQEVRGQPGLSQIPKQTNEQNQNNTQHTPQT